MAKGKMYFPKKNKSSESISTQVAKNRTEIAAFKKQVEHKYKRTRATGAALDLGSPLTYHLTAISESVASDGRLGVKIHVDWLSYRILLKKNNTNTREWARLTIVRDTQQISDTSPVHTEVLDTASANFAIAMPPRYEQKRFVICHDQWVNMSTNKPEVLVKGFYKCPKSANTYYNGSTTTDIQRNGYYLMITGESNVTFGTTDIAVDARYSDL